jgi:hypothetical protein
MGQLQRAVAVTLDVGGQRAMERDGTVVRRRDRRRRRTVDALGDALQVPRIGAS